MSMYLLPAPSMVIVWLAIGAVLLWPTTRPYVTRKGTTIHERILFVRAPAYWARSWYIRWSPRDGIFVRATCYDPEASAAYREAHR